VTEGERKEKGEERETRKNSEAIGIVF